MLGLPSQRRVRATRSARARAIATFARLPDSANPSFPQAIREAIERMDDPEPILRSIVAGATIRHRPRFAALYALLLRLRREERYGEYGALVRQFEEQFGTEPYFATFRAIISRVKGDLASLRSAVEHSRQAVEAMPDVAAVVHQLAAFWVEYLERLETAPSARDLDDVERHADRAIALSRGSVGHYLETKGRVLALRGEFEAARSAVTQAIEIEPRESRDFQRRLTQYQTTRVRIDLMQERARWARSQEQFRTELAEFKGQQLQLLGLLAAVVAFIVTAATIASQTDAVDGIRLMLAASGAIAVVFGTFSLLSNSSLRRVLVAIAVGSTMIGVGIIIPVSWLR